MCYFMHMFVFLKKSLRKIIGTTFLIGIILFNSSVAEDNDIKNQILYWC